MVLSSREKTRSVFSGGVFVFFKEKIILRTDGNRKLNGVEFSVVLYTPPNHDIVVLPVLSSALDTAEKTPEPTKGNDVAPLAAG